MNCVYNLKYFTSKIYSERYIYNEINSEKYSEIFWF